MNMFSDFILCYLYIFIAISNKWRIKYQFRILNCILERHCFRKTQYRYALDVDSIYKWFSHLNDLKFNL